MVSIIDYGAGNIKSVENAVRYLGHDVVLTRDPEVLLSSDHCILPGVGAFGVAMERLKHYGLDEVIREIVKREIPLLGICLGLQLLFESSEESPGAEGLGILKGRILRIPDTDGRKVPQIRLKSVDLPAPFEPRTVIKSPEAASRFTLFSAVFALGVPFSKRYR